MPVSSDYYNTLVLKANADALAKRTAYDNALARATGVEFDDSGKIKTDASGNIKYKKDASGNTLQGTLDVNYANQQRATAAGGEASGMLRSGQMARAKAEDLSTYQSNLMGAVGAATEGKTAVDTGLARTLAEYKAQYGDDTSSSGSSGSSSSNSSGGKSNTSTSTGSKSTGGKSVTTVPVYTPGTKPGTAVKPVTKKPGTVVLRPGRNIR